MEKKIYLDNAATTFVSGEVLNEMMPCFNAIYGNSTTVQPPSKGVHVCIRYK